jgi:Helix-turn-helix.
MIAENSFGLELRARRQQLGLSINKLAKRSGVSRRWIGCAEKDGNISMDVLRKLMQAMKMSAITICPGMTVNAGLSAPDTATLAAAVEDISRSAKLAQQAADRIKIFTLGVGKSARNDTPHDEGFNEWAAALVMHFAEHVRSLSDPEQLQKVEKAVSNLLRPEEDAPRTAKALPRRRRSSSA